MAGNPQEAMDTLNRSGVPRSDRSRASLGEYLLSVQTVNGLCTKDRKCVFKDGHETECWPKES